MPDYYVISANVLENARTVAAVGEKNAAKKAAERDGITGGRVAVVAVSNVFYKNLASTMTVEAED